MWLTWVKAIWYDRIHFDVILEWLKLKLKLKLLTKKHCWPHMGYSVSTWHIQVTRAQPCPLLTDCQLSQLTLDKLGWHSIVWALSPLLWVRNVWSLWTMFPVGRRRWTAAASAYLWSSLDEQWAGLEVTGRQASCPKFWRNMATCSFLHRTPFVTNAVEDQHRPAKHASPLSVTGVSHRFNTCSFGMCSDSNCRPVSPN